MKMLTTLSSKLVPRYLDKTRIHTIAALCVNTSECAQMFSSSTDNLIYVQYFMGLLDTFYCRILNAIQVAYTKVAMTLMIAVV